MKTKPAKTRALSRGEKRQPEIRLRSQATLHLAFAFKMWFRTTQKWAIVFTGWSVCTGLNFLILSVQRIELMVLSFVSFVVRVFLLHSFGYTYMCLSDF